ncbi:MFS transporter [Streptomyces olivaceus]|uniref:MFS transporter n=1 Tax=Streptomyces olivaceus TaxID=47716 RepID=UPI001CCF60B0|nr:MFS transporter [Streptomyces olivaceus]MBZ6176239.1 MFS transporter [Streptomyces olivaceus]MBZ6182561.1 MFS transporter [Streptomyces olivaceus]
MKAEHDHRTLVRGRTATSLLFLLFGTALGTWTSRIPAVKGHLGLSDGLLSLALLAFAVGSIVGMLLLGRLADRFGSTLVMVPTALLEGVLLVPPAYVGSLAGLAAALFLFGLTHGTLNIAMNANAVHVQEAYGRPIMSSFHAVYSIGGFLGAAVGGVLARQDVGPGATFITVGTGVLVLAGWAGLWALPETRPERIPPAGGPTEARGKDSVVSLDLIFLGLLAMCALVGEGTAADWSAVYMHESLGSSAGTAAAAFAAFSVAMTAGRLLGDRLAARFGPVRLVRASGVLASVGMLAALLIGHPAAGLVGFACLGAGMACIAPQVYSAAGRRNPARAGAALSLVVSLGYTGFLVGPIVVGAVSTVTGLPTALGVPVLLVLFVALGASALRPRADEAEGRAEDDASRSLGPPPSGDHSGAPSTSRPGAGD